MDFGEFGSAVFDPEAQTRRELTVEPSRVLRDPIHEAQTRRELKAKAPQRRAELAQCR